MFVIAGTKHQTEATSGRRSECSTPVGKAWQPECEAPGHTTCAVREQRRMAAAPPSPFNSFWDLCLWDRAGHIQSVSSLLGSNFLEPSCMHAQRCVSIVILNPSIGEGGRKEGREYNICKILYQPACFP